MPKHISDHDIDDQHQAKKKKSGKPKGGKKFKSGLGKTLNKKYGK